jgi:formylglycine-generating enzyme required for sulfatase activity/uncharacterized protein
VQLRWPIHTFLILATANAASFDCAKARTPSEKLICSTSELSALDDQAAAAYRAALTSAALSSPIPRSGIKADQQAWLKYVLSACSDAAIMREAYAARIATLQFAVNPVPAASAPQFTFLHYKRDEYSSLTQIRSVPIDPVVERANAWMRSTLASHPSATYYSDDVEVVAGRYVSTYVSTEDYYPGSAHGAPVRASLTLDRSNGKQIALDSLFRRGSKYAERLAALVNAELRLSWRHGYWQYEEDQVVHGLEGAPTDLFGLVAGGLAVHYRPYILGPYSSGDANIFIPYSKLADLADPNGPLGIAGKLPFTHKQDWEGATSASAPVLPRPPWKGVTKRNPRDGQLYVFIPAGRFNIGCCEVHTVILSKGFWIGQDPATQAAYQRVTGRDPSRFEGSPELPVESINWKEAEDYCRAASGRLPTEAEWEYAARAGTTADQYGPLDDIAWHSLNSHFTTHAVGQKPPNAFGLYDIIGNVSVWTADWGGRAYLARPDTDPIATTPSGIKIVRGGGYFSHPSSMEVWQRNTLDPSTRSDGIGVRCVASLPAP